MHKPRTHSRTRTACSWDAVPIGVDIYPALQLLCAFAHQVMILNNANGATGCMRLQYSRWQARDSAANLNGHGPCQLVQMCAAACGICASGICNLAAITADIEGAALAPRNACGNSQSFNPAHILDESAVQNNCIVTCTCREYEGTQDAPVRLEHDASAQVERLGRQDSDAGMPRANPVSSALQVAES